MFFVFILLLLNVLSLHAAENQERQKILKGDKKNYRVVRSNDTGSLVVAAVFGKTIQVGNLSSVDESGSLFSTSLDAKKSPDSLAVHPDAQNVFYSVDHKDHAVKLWDIRSGKCEQEVKYQGKCYGNLKILPDGGLFNFRWDDNGIWADKKVNTFKTIRLKHYHRQGLLLAEGCLARTRLNIMYRELGHVCLSLTSIDDLLAIAKCVPICNEYNVVFIDEGSNIAFENNYYRGKIYVNSFTKERMELIDTINCCRLKALINKKKLLLVECAKPENESVFNGLLGLVDVSKGIEKAQGKSVSRPLQECESFFTMLGKKISDEIDAQCFTQAAALIASRKKATDS